MHPYIHHQTVGQELRQPRLEPGHKAELAHILPPLGIPPCPLHQLLRLIHGHIFLHHRFAAVDGGTGKEGRPGPEGAKGHDPDAPAPQLPVQRPAEAQHKGLAGPVHVDIRNGLEGRHRGDVDDLPALRHIGDRQLTQGHHRLTVQIHHVQVHLQRRIHHRPELSEAAGVHQQAHLHRLLRQRLGIRRKAAAVRQIQRQRPHGKRHPLPQPLQRRLMAGDDPYLIKAAEGVHGLSEPASHTAGCPGDNCNALHIACSFPLTQRETAGGLSLPAVSAVSLIPR